MSQRFSGYSRMPRDTYVTPRWVYEALYTVEPWARDAMDCAPANADFDFLARDDWNFPRIATNPPFRQADKFCFHALYCAEQVAMLLPLAFDAAKGRRYLFADNPRFAAKYTILTRIRWENLKQKKAGPSTNHAWYVWDSGRRSSPTLGWL